MIGGVDLAAVVARAAEHAASCLGAPTSGAAESRLRRGVGACDGEVVTCSL